MKTMPETMPETMHETMHETMQDTSPSARAVQGVYRNGHAHWVGDGFRVHQVIPGPDNLTRLVDPFLMMDYHAPYDYPPNPNADTQPRGVGVHPHRGFETVTIAFHGSVAHHDSTGAGGVIHPGDVQWMTAARGVLHKEYHEAEWARRGGRFQMMQLWVNLPAAHKLDEPGYQALSAAEMGRVELPGGTEVTLIAGELAGVRGPAKTFTPIQLWDVSVAAATPVELPVPAGQRMSIFVVDGSVLLGERAEPGTAGAGELVVFDDDGDVLAFAAGETGARLVVLGGEPIGEPIASYGPFVMNTRAELLEAVEDFNAGRFGHLDD